MQAKHAKRICFEKPCFREHENMMGKLDSCPEAGLRKKRFFFHKAPERIAR